MPQANETSPPDSATARRSGLLARFVRSRSGATAVEFGMLSMPFFLMMVAILEVAMMFWSQQVLETAAANAARQIYTGQFQTDPSNANMTAAQMAAKFKTNLCANVVALFDCTNGVYVDIRNITDFNSAAVPAMVVGGQFNASAFSYQSVGGGQIALITAAIEYSTLTKIFVSTPGLTSGNRILVATNIFQTEPYQ